MKYGLQIAKYGPPILIETFNTETAALAAYELLAATILREYGNDAQEFLIQVVAGEYGDWTPIED
jgi:hypothetical protein